MNVLRPNAPTHGSHTHRVEETVHHIGTALGAVGLEVYVTPTGIIAKVTIGYEHWTTIRLVALGSLELSSVARLAPFGVLLTF